VALLLVVQAGVAQADDAITEPVRMVTSASAASDGDDAAARALALLMRRAGLRYSLSREPTERAVVSLRAGLFDADLLRYPQFDRIVPGAIRVDPHLLSTTLVAFSRSQEALAPKGWEALRGRRVAYVRGIKLIEQELGGQAELSATNGPTSCLSMAAAGRVDVCLLNAETSAAAPELIDGSRLKRTELIQVNLHIWVGPGHEALARRLSRALQGLVTSGELSPVVGAKRAH